MAIKKETVTSPIPPLPEQDPDFLQKRMDDERKALFPAEGELIDDGLRNRPPADIREEMLPQMQAEASELPPMEVIGLPEFDKYRPTGLAGDREESDAMAFIQQEIARLGAQLREELLSVASGRSNGISAPMVGAFFNCPECGIRIQGPSLTSQKGGLYDHGFGEAPVLGKTRCSFTGKRFKAPVIFLELAGGK